MKVAYVANPARKISFQFIWLIGIGFTHEFLDVGKYNVLDSVVIYIPFCRIDIIQYFHKSI